LLLSLLPGEEAAAVVDAAAAAASSELIAFIMVYQPLFISLSRETSAIWVYLKMELKSRHNNHDQDTPL
jgi:hypothetical protein